MQENVIKNEQAVAKPTSMQGKLSAEEQYFVRGLTKYSAEVNTELENMGFDKVKANKIHQVVGGFCSNSAIEIASRRLIKKYEAFTN